MHQLWKVLCFIALVAALPAQGQSLSLEEAQRRAIERSRQLAQVPSLLVYPTRAPDTAPPKLLSA